MEDCFRGVCNIGAGYEKAKCYCKAKYNTLEASAITEVKTKNQDWATNVEDPTYKATVQTLKKATVINSKTRHPHRKLQKKQLHKQIS